MASEPATTTALSEIESEALFADLPVALQQAVARGEVDLDTLLERVTGSQAELCPRCATRPITQRSTGLCRPCHDKALSAALREVRAEQAATQQRAAERKRSERFRTEHGIPKDPGATRRIAGLSCEFGVRRDGRPTLVGTFVEEAPDEFSMASTGRSFTPSSAAPTTSCDVCGRRFPDHGDSTCPRCHDRAAVRTQNSRQSFV